MLTGPQEEPRCAVVVGGELNALGVCRSLAAGKVRTYVLDQKRFNPAMWSRHATPVKAKSLQGSSLLEALRRLHAKLGDRPVLIVTDEMALLEISSAREELSQLYRFRLPEHGTVLMLHNKAQFQEYALANGFPVPRGEVLYEPADIRKIRRFRLPIIIKPADKRFVHSGDGPRLAVARDWASATRICGRLIEAMGEVLVQECVAGPDSNLYFCLFYRAIGPPTVIFTGRKLASSPPGAGSTAYCASASDMGKTLEPMALSLLEQLGYQGFGGIEYKCDAETGRFVIIEPTVGRTDWQEEIATLSGVNIPLAGYCHEYGLPQIGGLPDRQIVWQASYVERVKIGGDAIPAEATVIDGYWRSDDPMPALVHYAKDVFISGPAMAKGIAGRWSRRVSQRFHRRAGFADPI